MKSFAIVRRNRSNISVFNFKPGEFDEFKGVKQCVSRKKNGPRAKNSRSGQEVGMKRAL